MLFVLMGSYFHFSHFPVYCVIYVGFWWSQLCFRPSFPQEFHFKCSECISGLSSRLVLPQAVYWHYPGDAEHSSHLVEPKFQYVGNTEMFFFFFFNTFICFLVEVDKEKNTTVAPIWQIFSKSLQPAGLSWHTNMGAVTLSVLITGRVPSSGKSRSHCGKNTNKK